MILVHIVRSGLQCCLPSEASPHGLSRSFVPISSSCRCQLAMVRLLGSPKRARQPGTAPVIPSRCGNINCGRKVSMCQEGVLEVRRTLMNRVFQSPNGRTSEPGHHGTEYGRETCGRATLGPCTDVEACHLQVQCLRWPAQPDMYIRYIILSLGKVSR